MNQSLIDLETRLAFQEDLLQTLSEQLYDQNKRLQELERHNKDLSRHVRDLLESQDGGGAVDDAPPPHY